MRPLYSEAMPPKITRALKKLGDDVSIARRKRGLTVNMMCERMMVSKQTYQRIENGDPSVSLGAFAMAMFALGEENRIESLLDVSGDDVGLITDLDRLPKRVRGPK